MGGDFFIDPVSGGRALGGDPAHTTFTQAQVWNPSLRPLDPHDDPLSVSAELTGVDGDLAPNITGGKLVDGGASKGSLLQGRAYDGGAEYDSDDDDSDCDYPDDSQDDDECDGDAQGLRIFGHRPDYYMGRQVQYPARSEHGGGPGPFSRSRQ